MPDRRMDLRTLVEFALSALPQELGCDTCGDYLAAYAEYQLGGEIPPSTLKGVGEHLERCDACLEEFERLLDAMRAAKEYLGEGPQS